MQKQFRIISSNMFSRKRESLGIGSKTLRGVCRFLASKYMEHLSAIVKTDEATLAVEQVSVFLSVDQPHGLIHETSIETIL